VDGAVETSSLSGSLEGASGVVLWDFGWYFESAGITPPFYFILFNTDGFRMRQRKKERNMEGGRGVDVTNPF
jgi:hypothetical protein